MKKTAKEQFLLNWDEGHYNSDHDGLPTKIEKDLNKVIQEELLNIKALLITDNNIQSEAWKRKAEEQSFTEGAKLIQSIILSYIDQVNKITDTKITKDLYNQSCSLKDFPCTSVLWAKNEGECHNCEFFINNTAVNS